MIKKAQVKFICIIMSILLGCFVIISCVTAAIMHNVNNRNIEHILNDISQSIPLPSEKKNYDDSFIVKLHRSNNTYEIISSDAIAFSESEIKEVVEKIILRPEIPGRLEDVFYRFVDFRGDMYLVAFNASHFADELSAQIVRMIIIYIILYLALFIIVYLISFNVFEPIKENFAKQRQFVSNASHELKTPLTIISANADVLKQSQDNQWIDNIKAQTERLEKIIIDMLEMAKLDEAPPKLIKENFNLSDEIIKATLPFDAVAFEKNKNLELNVLPDIIYNGNSESVKQILNILLDNAVKYSNTDGIIKVSLTKKNGKNILSVYNTGSAVPSNQAKKIFERFYRYDNSRSRETGGSGLGLAIAKGIAKANNWKISATSRPNEYMLITVVL